MARFATRFAPAPVRLSRAQARSQQQVMLLGAPRVARGAGNYGSREARYASVPIALRIDRRAGPNTPGARAAALPIAPLRRKRGYPPLPEAREGA